MSGRWDARNRLTAVTDYNSSGHKTQEVHYDYDLHDRWIGEKVTTFAADGQTATNVHRTSFIYDGNQIVLQFESDTANEQDQGQNWQLTYRYLWGSGVDQLLSDEQITTSANGGTATTTSTVVWPLADNLGTIRDLATSQNVTDATTGVTTFITTVVNHRVYDSYGNLLSQVNPVTGNAPTVDCLFGYTGRPLDTTTGQVNMLHRWYDAKTGQWLSVDPEGYGAGDGNTRRYCGNDPIEATDASGCDAKQALVHEYETQKAWADAETYIDQQLAFANRAKTDIERTASLVGERAMASKQTSIQAEVEDVQGNATLYINSRAAAFAKLADMAQQQGADSDVFARLANKVQAMPLYLNCGVNLYLAAKEIAQKNLDSAEKRCNTTIGNSGSKLSTIISGLQAAQKAGEYAGYVLLAQQFYQATAKGGAWLVVKTTVAVAGSIGAGKAAGFAAQQAGAPKEVRDAAELGGTLIMYAILHSKLNLGDETSSTSEAPAEKPQQQYSQQQQARPRSWAAQPNAYWASGNRVFPTNANSGLTGDALFAEQKAFFKRGLLEGKLPAELRGQASVAGYKRVGGWFSPNDHLALKSAERALQEAIEELRGGK